MAYSSGLAEYALELFKDYKTNKEDFIKKCKENLNSFKGIDNHKNKRAKEGEGWRSKIFIKLVKVKIFAALAMLLDFLLQGGKVPFALKESEFEDTPEEVEETAVDRMTNKIEDQLETRKADKETKRSLFSMALYGMAWKKYNVEAFPRSAYKKIMPEEIENPTPDLIRYERSNTSEMIPGHRYVSIWSMFWDMEEEDVQKMQGLFERTLVSPFELRKKIGKPFYIDSAIKKVISEAKKQEKSGSDDAISPIEGLVKKRKRNIQDLEYWGRVPRKLVEEFESELPERQKSEGAVSEVSNINNLENDGDEVEVLIELAGDNIIRFKRTDGKRPYKYAKWEEVQDETIGVGIADNGEGVQEAYNKTLRAISDNTDLAGNVILALKERFLEPGAFDELTPGMRIRISDECDDARKAVQQIMIESMVKDLYPLLAMLLALEDDVTQIPKILYGVIPKGQGADTAFQSNQLQENAGKYLGDVIRGYDQNIIEPEIRDIYDYNMDDPEIPVDAKCPCTVHATGFTGFQNKIIKGNSIRQMLALIFSDPTGELKAKSELDRMLEELWKSYDLDPDEFIKSEEKQMKEAQDRANMEAQAKAEAELLIQKKIAAETEAAMAKKEHEAELGRRDKEDDFQRGIIKDEISPKKAVNE